MFEYVDKDGNNECNAECMLSANVESCTVQLGVYSGDMDGNSYTLYAPNHIEALEKFKTDLEAVIERAKTLPKGYDGFNVDVWFASETDCNFDPSIHDYVDYYREEEPGVVRGGY